MITKSLGLWSECKDNENLRINLEDPEMGRSNFPYKNIYCKNIYLNVKRELITIWSSCADVNNSHNKVVVCYVDRLAAYFPGNGQFLIENIDPMLCTHIVYGFAVLDNITHSIQSQDSELDTEEGGGKGK